MRRRGRAAVWMACWLLGHAVARADATPEPAYAAHAVTTRTAAPGALNADDAAKLAGTLGDPTRALLDQPGVARSGFAGSELVLWGSAPNESRVYVDGTEIPALFHPSGFRTTVHPVLLRQLSLTPGAQSAQYGRSLGGTVELSTRNPARTRPHLSLRADAIDTSLSGEGSVGAVSALAGVRYGYLDRVVQALAPDTQGVLAIPSHMDGAARVVVAADKRTQLGATWIGARDHTALATGPAAGDVQRRDNNFHSAMLQLDRRYADGARVRISPSVGVRDNTDQSAFSGLPISLAERAYNAALRAEYTRSIALLSGRVGLDVRVERSRVARAGTLTFPAREGDIRLFGQAPVASVNADHFRATVGNVAPYTTLTFRVRAWELEPGLRLETLFTSSTRSVPAFPGAPAVGADQAWLFVEPRVRIALHHNDVWRSELRVGVYHQPPAATDLSAVFGSPALTPARALHGALSTRAELPYDVDVELIGFAKQLRDLSVRNGEQPPALASALTADGRGAAYGGSLSVRRNIAAGLFFALNYTLSHSVRSDADGSLRRFDKDQPHVFTSLLGFTFARFSANARARAASGNPRTRVVSRYLDTDTGAEQPLFGRHNGARNPAFFALDLHAEYDCSWRALSCAVFADVLNVTDHKNVEEVAFAPDLHTRRDVRGLPFLAMLGGKLGY